MKYLHYGIPSNKLIEGKNYAYVEPLKLHATNAADDEFGLQYVHAEEDSPLPEIVRTQMHISMKVDDIHRDIDKWDEVAFPPTSISDKVTMAFVVKDGALFELMEIAN